MNLFKNTLVIIAVGLLPLQGFAGNSHDRAGNSEKTVSIDNDSKTFEQTLRNIQNRWATIYYYDSTDEKKPAEFTQLAIQAQQFADKYPDRAEPMVWQGIIHSTWAGAEGGLGALTLVKQAKAFFEKSLSIDETALNGSAYTSLGSLYYQVPGWPLSFGSDKQAKKYLEKALSINPDGIDSNYFYADYLIQSEGDYKLAKVYLEKARQAEPRPNRTLEDEGRKRQINDRMKLVARNL